VSRSAGQEPQGRRLGERTLRALQVVTIGMFVLLAMWMCSGIFVDDVPRMPSLLWVVAVLVAPAALVVYWRPAHRVPECLFLTGASALFLSLGGAAWGSWVAPVIGGVTIVGLLVAPRDPGREQSGRRAVKEGTT
jgi:hypothetical protein